MLISSISTCQSEEDKQLQEDLEMMVERLSVSILKTFSFLHFNWIILGVWVYNVLYII